jgi:hypothetical protein
MRCGRIVTGVIASEVKQSRLGDCGCGFVWIASLSLAMTTDSDSMQKPRTNPARRRAVDQE